jgi:hypothetical protein
MKYSLAEVRKTAAASIGTAISVAGYLIADNSPVREILPPEWVAIIGMLVTVLGVFFAPNAPSKDVIAAVEDTKTVLQELQDQVHSKAPDIPDSMADTAVSAIDRVNEILNRHRTVKP